MIRLCKTLLLAELIRLLMADNTCCKYRPIFLVRMTYFFAEEFVIWKQQLRKTLNLSVIQTVNFSCPLFVCSAG